MAATTANLELRGVIEPEVNLSVVGENNYNALDLSATVSDLVVAKIRSQSNTNAGYSIKLSSQNAGKLKNSASGSVSYTAKFNDNPVPLKTSEKKIFDGAGGLQNVTHDFAISYTGRPKVELEEGTYTDTLTFTIKSK